MEKQNKKHIKFKSNKMSHFSTMNISNLNDDCLECICQCLSLRDRINFAFTCKRFRFIFQTYFGFKYKKLNMRELRKLPFRDIRNLLELIGTHVEHLYAVRSTMSGKNFEAFFNCLGDFCPNIRSFTFMYKGIDTLNMGNLFRKLKSLTFLDLTSCSLCDDNIWALKILRHLQVLILSNNRNITGKHLHTHRQLRELHLNGCTKIQNFIFVKICKSLRHLDTLDILYCRSLRNVVQQIVGNCRKLQSLKLSISSEEKALECTAQLVHLRKLTVEGPMSGEFFPSLASQKANDLEYLEIKTDNYVAEQNAMLLSKFTQLQQLMCTGPFEFSDVCMKNFTALSKLTRLHIFACDAITNKGLLSIVTNCIALNYISVNFCENISDEFVFSAIEVMRQRQPKPKQQLLIDVSLTGVQKKVLNDPRYMATEPLLHLIIINY